MDKRQDIKQALHAANIFLFTLIVFYIVLTRDSRAWGWEADTIFFVACLEMGAVILALYPNRRISLGLIALGFVLCCAPFIPPPKHGTIVLSVGALIFWAYVGNKKWWLFPIPPLIAIILILFESHDALFKWKAFVLMLKVTLSCYSIVLLCTLCAYPIRNAHWFLRCLVAIVVFWLLNAQVGSLMVSLLFGR